MPDLIRHPFSPSPWAEHFPPRRRAAADTGSRPVWRERVERAGQSEPHAPPRVLRHPYRKSPSRRLSFESI